MDSPEQRENESSPRAQSKKQSEKQSKKQNKTHSKTQSHSRREREHPVGPETGGLTIPRRIAFINEKGGSGKTTLVANVAAHLAATCGRRTLAIDMDPQGQLGKVLGVEVRRPRRSAIELLVDTVLGEPATPSRDPAAREPAPSGLPIVRTRIEGLDLIVGNKSLALFPGFSRPGGPRGDDDATGRLAAALDAADELAAYDFVLFDAPPSFGPLTLNVLRACREVVVPCPLTFLALDGCAELMRTLDLVRRRYHHEALALTLVIPTFYRRTRLANECLDRLRKRFPAELSATVVGYHVKLDEAQSRGLSIFEYAPRDAGALEMAALADELVAREPAAAAPRQASEAAPAGACGAQDATPAAATPVVAATAGRPALRIVAGAKHGESA